MKFFKLSSWIILFIILISCTENRKFESQYYHKENRIWSEYLSSIGLHKQTLANNILLFMRTSECKPSMNELTWWNDNMNEINNVDVSLILLERYNERINSFISQHSISIPAFPDSGATVFKRNLIPASPIKVYFGKDGNIHLIDRIGSGGNLNLFLSTIKNKSE